MIRILIALICLCTQAGRALQVKQPYRLVASGGEVRLHCSYDVPGSPEEMRVVLYKGGYGEQQVCNATFNVTQSHFQTEGPVRCSGQPRPGGVDLVVSGLRAEDTDLYRCRMEVHYPPPYLVGFGNGTIFYIPEKADCSALAAQTHEESEDSGSTQDILPIVVLISFTLLIITIIIVIYKFIDMRHKKTVYAHMAPVISKRVDCRFGYENFL